MNQKGEIVCNGRFGYVYHGTYAFLNIILLQEMEKQPTEFDPVPMDSEDDLFIAYTSGTSSKPRLIVHTQAGYLLYAAFTHKVQCAWLHCSTDIVCMS